MSKTIITIGRQYGAGGLEIGKRLAEKLNYKFYDKEIISLASKESGYTESIFEQADEKPTNSFLYSIAIGAHPLNSMFLPTNDLLNNDTLFNIQSKVIKKVAKENDAVIVGRCADYVLREEENLIRVFLYADMQTKKDRVKKLEGNGDLTDKALESLIIKADKKRSSYYSYYSGNEWGNASNYDLMINTSKLGVEGTIKLITDYIDLVRK